MVSYQDTFTYILLGIDPTSGTIRRRHAPFSNSIRRKSKGVPCLDQYFSILDHLSIQTGYTLGFVYLQGVMMGEPILYARKQGQEARWTVCEFHKSYRERLITDPDREFLDHVQIDGTAKGYWQYVLLFLRGGQFCFRGHSNYWYFRVVATLGSLARRRLLIHREFGVPREVRDKAHQVQLSPRVSFGDHEVEVKGIVYSPWRGLVRRTFVIKRPFPHTMVEKELEILVPYRSGMLF